MPDKHNRIKSKFLSLSKIDGSDDYSLIWRVSRFRTFMSLPVGRKALLIEAGLTLLVSYLLVRFVPFRIWSNWAGYQITQEFLSEAPSSNPKLGHVKWAIDAVSRRVPAFTCLMIALAGQTMLRWRKIPSVIVFGVDIKREGDKGNIFAHAWLTSGPHVVFGNTERDRYTAVCFLSSR